MKNPFDSMFGRLVVTTVGLLVLVHLTSLLLIEQSRASLAALHISRVVEAAASMGERESGGDRSVADILGISFADLKQLPAADAQRFRGDTNGPIERQCGTCCRRAPTWQWTATARCACSPRAACAASMLPQADVPLYRFTGALALTLAFAVVVAVMLAWRFNGTVRDLAARRASIARAFM
jgi:two-component system osmolarity sensor histidine kinase EnvZ